MRFPQKDGIDLFFPFLPVITTIRIKQTEEDPEMWRERGRLARDFSTHRQYWIPWVLLLQCTFYGGCWKSQQPKKANKSKKKKKLLKSCTHQSKDAESSSLAKQNFQTITVVLLSNTTEKPAALPSAAATNTEWGGSIFFPGGC